MQGAAPYHSTLQGSAIGFGHLHKELAVVQQEVLARPGCMHQRRRAGDTPLPQPEALAWFQHKGLGQRADAQLRPLQVDEQLGDAHGVDDIQPVFVGRKGPVGRFMRMPVMPASTMRCKVSSWAQAGPMVP